MHALLLFAAMMSPGHATQVTYDSMDCPLGGGSVRVYDMVSANKAGGYDSDGAEYSAEGQFREFAISTCEENLFSIYGKDIGVPIDAAMAKRLDAALKQEVSKLSSPDDPAVWDRYAIAARMYREMGRDPMFLAKLYTEASWTARDGAVGVYAGLAGPEQTRGLLEGGKAELRKDLPIDARKRVLYNLARVAHRGGYNAERDAFLAAFEAAGPVDATESAALARFRHLTQEVEPRFQDLALKELARAMATESLPAQDRLQATYLTADLLRRRDRKTEALAHYATVMNDPRTPAVLRELAVTLYQEPAPTLP